MTLDKADQPRDRPASPTFWPFLDTPAWNQFAGVLHVGTSSYFTWNNSARWAAPTCRQRCIFRARVRSVVLLVIGLPWSFPYTSCIRRAGIRSDLSSRLPVNRSRLHFRVTSFASAMTTVLLKCATVAAHSLLGSLRRSHVRCRCSWWWPLHAPATSLCRAGGTLLRHRWPRTVHPTREPLHSPAQ